MIIMFSSLEFFILETDTEVSPISQARPNFFDNCDHKVKRRGLLLSRIGLRPTA
jgi:hypothetical protein